MEQYFKAVHADEEDNVTIRSMYLTGDAKLWWRTRIEDTRLKGEGKAKVATAESQKDVSLEIN